MKWAPKSFNDTLALVIVIGFPIFIGWCFARQFTGEAVMLVIGQLAAILLLVAQYFYRKKGADDTMTTSTVTTDSTITGRSTTTGTPGEPEGPTVPHG